MLGLHHNCGFTSEAQLTVTHVGARVMDWTSVLSGLISGRLDWEGLWKCQDFRELKANNSFSCPLKCMWYVPYVLCLRRDDDIIKVFLFPLGHLGEAWPEAVVTGKYMVGHIIRFCGEVCSFPHYLANKARLGCGFGVGRGEVCYRLPPPRVA